MQPKTTILSERLDLSEALLDSDRRVIENVVLIRAGMSKNRRHYSEATLQAAAPIFEGARAYANHPTKAEAREGRSIRDLTGWYAGVRYREGRLIATRHFLNTEAGKDAWEIARAIVEGEAPKTFAGLSINAVGTGKVQKYDDGDALNVESITHAFSVDDVDTPAAGGGYALTANDGDALTRELLQAMSFQEWFDARPEYVKRVTNELKTQRDTDGIKAAKAEAAHNRNALVETQARIETLEAEREAARRDADEARRALAIETALAKSRLPQAWRESLRRDLEQASADQWSAILEREQAKARTAGVKPTVSVTGAEQQVQRTPRPETRVSEGLDWASIESPEALERALARLRTR